MPNFIPHVFLDFHRILAALQGEPLPGGTLLESAGFQGPLTLPQPAARLAYLRSW